MSITELLALFAGFMVILAFSKKGAMVFLRVRSMWSAEAALALSELDLYSGPEPDRVRVDILSLSEGSLEDLRRWVKMANNYHRAVISAAEYSYTKIGSETLREFREWKPPENQEEVSFKGILS
jgi:hypothetical protein